MLATMGLGLVLILVDPLVKVFPDSLPAASRYIAEIARGEVAEWQVLLRSDEEVRDVRIEVGEMRGPGGSRLGRPHVRAIGFVPVEQSIPAPPKDRLGKVPGPFPDPLLPDAPTTLEAGRNRPIWVDLAVPQGAAPGEYAADLTVRGTSARGPVDARVKLRAKVYPVSVGASRLWVTNWFSPPSGVGHDDPEFWRRLRSYADNMASHRQNVALIGPLNLAEIRQDGSFDFSLFDRWVETFARAGVIGRIEGGHLGGRIGGEWSAQFEMTIRERKDGKTVSRNVDPKSAEAKGFYSRFLPALVRHLEGKGWLGIYSQHLADEPIESNIASYVAMRELVREVAPKLRVIEANHTAKLAGSMDVWVPQLNYYADSYEFYRQRQAAGEEVWFYTCVYPQGEYANRFIEQPLIKTRLLHWMNFKYGATGYLHWGWNRWSHAGQGLEAAFEKVTYQQPGGSFLPAGDCFIVYPAEDGGVLDSIRWETMRDGIADHELLSMLAEKNPFKAGMLADRLVMGFQRYSIDPEVFREVRRDLLNALARG